MPGGVMGGPGKRTPFDGAASSRPSHPAGQGIGRCARACTKETGASRAPGGVASGVPKTVLDPSGKERARGRAKKAEAALLPTSTCPWVLGPGCGCREGEGGPGLRCLFPCRPGYLRCPP